MKLTSTNRPFGLIIKLSQTVFGKEQRNNTNAFVWHSAFDISVELVKPALLEVRCWRFEEKSASASRLLRILLSRSRAMSRPIHLDKIEWTAQNRAGLQVSGDQTARVTPVPIPNTEVKPRRADDTAWVTVWERRSSPGLN